MRFAIRCPSCQLYPRSVVFREARRYAARTLCEGSRDPSKSRRFLSSQTSHTSAGQDFVPFRKQLKDEAKARRGPKTTGDGPAKTAATAQQKGWELTVGIEVHAQLHTDCKLFSGASAATDHSPNTSVALFDVAFPGSQPRFQAATLIPALRAAIALNCDIQRASTFDRKHYFYQDQPAGYQITQYYEPYARNGSLSLHRHDGIAPEDGDSVQIGIKQIQMEQDTAKSQELPSSTYLLDFNRVSRPLVEIITLPQIHSPATAAACARKIQATLRSCGAVATGMEMGGLRADVNVSVRKSGGGSQADQQYDGIGGLGQRTEIKNLSSFKAVEDAVTAERDRQIAMLEAGGVVEGQTRGWTIGGTETRKLRVKEGEVDYRYMPDPDIPPVIVGGDVLNALKSSMPMLPDEALRTLTEDPMDGLGVEDAKTLIELDDGARLDYYQRAVGALHSLQQDVEEQEQEQEQGQDVQSPNLESRTGQTVANWVLHELGGLFSKAEEPWNSGRVKSKSLANIIHLLLRSQITTSTAKSLLTMIFDGDKRTVQQIVDEDNLIFRPMSREEYVALAEQVISDNPKMIKQIQEKGQTGKIGWLVGQIRQIGGRGRVEGQRADEVLRELLLK